MKIQCNCCEVAEAKVFCCADEAALCWACDQKIHAANKLARKHQRIPLSSSTSQMPKCDICQETSGYFFCLEDRALLCRKCDVAIHTANSLVSSHRRFLLTGVRVGLETSESSLSSTKGKSRLADRISETASSQSVCASTSVFLGDSNEVFSGQITAGGIPLTSKSPLSGGTITGTGNFPQSHFDEYSGFPDFMQNYGVLDSMASKAYGGYCL